MRIILHTVPKILTFTPTNTILFPFRQNTICQKINLSPQYQKEIAMKRILILFMLIAGTIFVLMIGCKKTDPPIPSDTSKIPTVATKSVGNITFNSVFVYGEITADGGTAITEAGICLNETGAPTISDNTVKTSNKLGNFTCLAVGLKTLTNYYVRVYATNKIGTTYGETILFTTSAYIPPTIKLPTVKTKSVGSVSSNSAFANGEVVSNGGENLNEVGLCWATNNTPTTGDYKLTTTNKLGDFGGKLTNLELITKYYVRAYAKNSAGTAYGETLSLTTYDSVVDIDGNIYFGIKIGNQVWLTSNLKTTHFRNGEAVPNVTDNNAWSSLNGPGYCWFNNDISHKELLGALYNWWVGVDSRNIAPIGYHIPNRGEIETLGNALGGLDTTLITPEGEAYNYLYNGGYALQGTTLWSPAYGNATNSSGFNALPSGFRFYGGGYFINEPNQCNWWLTNKYDADCGWNFYLPNNNSNHFMLTGKFYNKKTGKSLRCIKD